MKRYLLGMIGFGLLGATSLLAQTPTAGQSVPIPGTVLPGSTSEVIPVHGLFGNGCEGSRCAAPATVCVPECYTKVRKTVVFSSGCEPLCLCPIGCHRGHRDCGECENGRCEHPYTVKYLVKKVRTCEENAVKCVPGCAPGCATGSLHHHAAAPSATAPVITPAVTTPDRADTVYPRPLP